jgi:hypothetical protein
LATAKTRIIFLDTILLVLLLIVPVNAVLNWNVQTVDENAEAGYCSIAFDSNNLPHAAYTDIRFWWNGQYYSELSVMYTSYNGTDRGIQNITEGRALGLVLDTKYNPHILYSNYDALLYASWTGSNWTTSVIDSNAGGFGVVALDSLVIHMLLHWCRSNNKLCKLISSSGVSKSLTQTN